MLSELCVRRPVFATMLVMSLVVLGIFSFRDLGVDLFPKADPATVNVIADAARRQPRRNVDVGGRADGRGDQQRLRHRRDQSPRISEGRGTHHRPVRARARHQRRRQRRPREGAARDAQRAAAAAAAGHHQGRSRLRPGDVDGRLVEDDEPAHADRDRRQAGARARSRRSTASARSIWAAAAPAKSTSSSTSQKLDAYGLSMRQVRDAVVAENIEIPGGTVEQGKGAAAAADARPRRRHRRLQQHRRRDARTARRSGSPTSATPKTASSGRPARSGWATRRRCCSTSAGRWARTPSR